MPIGESGVLNVWFKYLSYANNWYNLKNISYIKVKGAINQTSEIQIDLFALTTDQKFYVREFAEVIVLVDTTTLIKGYIRKIEYTSEYDCKITANGIEINLVDKEFTELSNTSATWTDAKRAQYTNVSAQTIAKELLSENSNGSTPWIVTPSSGGLFTTDYGIISMRYEYANRLNCLASLADAIDYEWWTSSTKSTENIVNAHGVSLASGGSVSYKAGVKIYTKTNCYIIVTKHASCTATKAYLLDSNLTELQNVSFSGDNATFTYDLLPNTSYYILADNSGSGYTIMQNLSASCPYISTNLNFTAGYAVGTGEVTTMLWNIVSITAVANTYTDYFNIDLIKGNQTSVYTFNISGSGSNSIVTSKEVDVDQLINYVDLLGAKQGEAQLHTSTYAASPTWTTLNSSDSALNESIDAVTLSLTFYDATHFSNGQYVLIESEKILLGGKSGNTFSTCTRGQYGTTAVAHSSGVSVINISQITLTDGSNFPLNGTIRIMEEQIIYSSRSGNILTLDASGAPRGYGGTTASQHKVDCYVEKYVSSTSPEAGSSLALYGKKDYTIADITLVDLATAEILASKYLIDHKDPITRLRVDVMNPIDILKTITLGDMVTVLDETQVYIYTQLNGAITPSNPPTGGSLTVDSTTGFTTVGTLLIDSEQITYNGKTATTFINITRGANGTTAASHTDNSYVNLISQTARFVSFTYTEDYGDMKLEIELSSRSPEFIEQMNKIKQESATLAKYVQGTTNSFSLHQSESVNAIYPLYIRFYIPTELAAINALKISTLVTKYRGYNYLAEAETTTHYHSVPGSSHNHPIAFGSGRDSDRWDFENYNNSSYKPAADYYAITGSYQQKAGMLFNQPFSGPVHTGYRWYHTHNISGITNNTIPANINSQTQSSTHTHTLAPNITVQDVSSQRYRVYIRQGFHSGEEPFNTDGYLGEYDGTTQDIDGTALVAAIPVGSWAEIAIKPLAEIGTPKFYYHFNEGNGTTAYDSSGNGYDLIGFGSGASVWSSSAKLGSYCTIGDGDDAWWYTPSLTVQNNFSVCAWINLSGTTGNRSIVGTRYSSDYSFDMKIMAGNAQIHGDIGNGTSWITTAADANYSFSTGIWYFVCYTISPTEWKIYINGNLINNGSYVSNTPLFCNSSHNVNIMQSGIGEYFIGKVDDVRIYDFALDPTEVNILYNYSFGTETVNPDNAFSSRMRLEVSAYVQYFLKSSA